MSAQPRPRHVVQIDLENPQHVLLQKLILLEAARHLGDVVYHLEGRHFTVHIGPHQLDLPIRPGVEHLAISPADEMQLAPPSGLLSREAASNFRPTADQKKTMACLKGGKRLGYTELEQEVGRWFGGRDTKNGDRRGGYQQLMELAILDQDQESGLYFLTEIGEAAADEFCVDEE